MNARLARFLPSFPYLLGALVAGALILALWLAPALQAGSMEKTVEGRVQTFSWRGDVEHTDRLEWPYQIHIEDDANEVAILPRLLFSFSVSAGSDAGTADLAMDIRIFINGIEAHHRQTGATSHDGQQGGYTYFNDFGLPDSLGEVNQGLLRQGNNDILVRADLRLTVETEGTERFDAAIGPVHSYLYQADGDGDGVVDVHQPLQGVHTGWIAIPAAGLAGTGAWFLARFARARMGA